ADVHDTVEVQHRAVVDLRKWLLARAERPRSRVHGAVLVTGGVSLRFNVATQRNTPRPPLRLRPFRGMRYDSTVVGDIAAVTSPPYDVMDRPMIDALLQQHSRNIVRLILPRMVNDPVTGGNPYD